jgi:hypothetical protein
MIGFGDFQVKLEQHHDHLRRAEKNHLIAQVTGNRKSGLWQMVSNLRPATAGQNAHRDSLEIGRLPDFAEEPV